MKNQSKDRRKIEIQHNLQKKRDNSLVLRESTNNDETGQNTVMLQTNSTLEQPLGGGEQCSLNNLLMRGNNLPAKGASGGGKKFQLKAVDVGNIYKSLKMGQ